MKKKVFAIGVFIILASWGNCGISSEELNPIRGGIEIGLLEKKNLILDFGNPNISMSNYLKQIKSGYDLTDFYKSHVEKNKVDIKLTLYTEKGDAEFSLDKGPSIRSSFKPSSKNRSSKSKDDKDFKSVDFHIGYSWK